MSLRRRIKAVVWQYLLSGMRDALAMSRIQPVVEGGGYLPWSDSALSATAIATVMNDIMVNGRSTVVECGGGISSLYIASLLKKMDRRDAHLYTIEHDGRWLATLDEMIDEYEVGQWVTLVHAELSESELSWNGEAWYNGKVIEAELPGVQIDLLLVDGPPAHLPENSHSRYPAGPFFSDMLSNRCCIILDDASRDAEHEIIQAWEDELDIGFTERLLNGDIAVGIRGRAFSI